MISLGVFGRSDEKRHAGLCAEHRWEAAARLGGHNPLYQIGGPRSAQVAEL
jgi:hypothetical protein